MGRTACTGPQCLYKGALYLTFTNTQETGIVVRTAQLSPSRKMVWMKSGFKLS